MPKNRIPARLFVMFKLILLLGSILFIRSSIATMDLNHPLSITELIEIALENHPSTSQTWWSARKAAASLGIAESLYYPEISIEGKAQHGRDFKFINGPDTTYTILGADTIVSFLLYDFGERKASVEQAKMALLTANWHIDWNIQKVIVKVLENAYTTFYAQQVVENRTLSLNEAENILEAAKELKIAGLRSISDVYTSQASVYQIQMELIQEKAFLDIQKGKLSASLGLPSNTPIKLNNLEPFCAPPKSLVDTLIAASNFQRADLMAKYSQLCESNARMKRVDASYKPKLFIYGRGGFERGFHQHEKGANYQIGLSLDIPIFNGFKNIYEKRLAHADMQLTNEELANLKLEISLEVLTYAHLLEAAQEMVPFSEENLKNATEAYQSIISRYKAGKESIIEVFVAHKQLTEARIRYNEIRMQWLVALANLAYATGTIDN